MDSAIDLCESRVSEITTDGHRARISFSHAYIRKSRGRAGQDPGTAWSQPVEITVQEAALTPSDLPTLPNTINEGFLEIGGVRYELVPLPFTRRGEVLLDLVFTDGSALQVSGFNPTISVVGPPIFLESTP